MAPEKKLRKLIGISVFLFVLLGGLSVISWYVVKSYRRAGRFHLALETLEQGDQANALLRLLAVVEEDPNNETAFARLAEILEERGNWTMAARYWNSASHLNPLEEKYRSHHLHALLLARDFQALYSVMMLSPPVVDKASDEQFFSWVMANFQTNRRDDAERLMQGVPPMGGFSKSEFYPLLTEIFRLGKPAPQFRENVLLKLSNSQNPVTAFEATLLRLYLLSGKKGITSDELEPLMKRLATINPMRGRISLAQFYAMRARFPDAIRLLQEDLDFFYRASVAVFLAELYVFTGKREELRELTKRLASGDKQSIRSAYYLDALGAFMDQDFTRMKELLQGTGMEFASPLAHLLALRAAIETDDMDSIIKRYEQCLEDQPFLDIRTRVRLMMEGYYQLLLAKGKLPEAANLAERLIDPKKPDQVMLHLVLLKRLGEKTLDRAFLNRALQIYPEDPFVLQTAAEFSFQLKDYAGALDYTKRCLAAKPPADSSIFLIRILSLEQLNRIPEAASLYLLAVKDNPTNTNLMGGYYDFCVRHGRKEDLQSLAEWMKSNAEKNRDFAEFLPFVEAEIALLNGDLETADQKMAAAKTDRPALLFRAAFILGRHDRFEPAIRNYLALLDRKDIPNRALLLINLSELYQAKGQTEDALKTAEQAFQMDPDGPNVRTCFLRRLRERKEYIKILNFAALPARRSEADSERFSIWIEAAEAILLKMASGEEESSVNALELCRELSKRNPDSPAVKAYRKHLRDTSSRP